MEREHERCYIYTPPATEERPSKRQRTNKPDPHSRLGERLSIYRDIWSKQEERIQATLEDADSSTQEKIANFVAASAEAPSALQWPIPTGLIIAGPSIASHSPFFQRLGQRIKAQTDSVYVVITSAESPNLKTFLKNLIRKITSRVDDDEDELGRTTLSRRGPKLLDFDLGQVHEWQKKNAARSIVVAIQDSEAFDTAILIEIVDLFYSWSDRLPFVLLFGIATSAESFEDRLSGHSLRFLEGQKFDVTQSDEIIEKVFSATVAGWDNRLWIGPNLSRRMLDRQKDHIQNVQDFVDGLKYAYMSHFYASYPTIVLKENLMFKDLHPDVFEAIRNLPSFRRNVEEMLELGRLSHVRQLLDDDKYLFDTVVDEVKACQDRLSTLGFAAKILTSIRESLQLSPNVRLSSVWPRAASGELLGSPLLRETMLSIKKMPSNKLTELFASLLEADGSALFVNIRELQQQLDDLIKNNAGSTPLRSQDDVRNDSLRTTVVAQKVLLSKHKAALSEQDKAYSDLVGRFHDELNEYFSSAFADPRTIFMSEVVMYDSKSPHTEVFQPKPRFAVERALAYPHDYLGCDCCALGQDGEAALSATQPATAILYQLYLESGAVINVADLWSAFKAMVGDDEEEEDTSTRALFQRALAELKYLGLVKPSRKKTDHIAKMMWKGL